MMRDEFDRFLSDFRMVIMSDEQIKYIDDVLLVAILLLPSAERSLIR